MDGWVYGGIVKSLSLDSHISLMKQYYEDWKALEDEYFILSVTFLC